MGQVFHGSPLQCFEVVEPKRNIRSQPNKDGKQKVIFDQLSFHATPHRWIGLAYTYQSSTQNVDDREIYYNMGVSLYSNNQRVAVFGTGSLEESLERLYGNGGYLYVFDDSHFFHTEGLGSLELITQSRIRPLYVERIDDPVRAMQEYGVTFRFIDELKKPNAR